MAGKEDDDEEGAEAEVTSDLLSEVDSPLLWLEDGEDSLSVADESLEVVGEVPQAVKKAARVKRKMVS